ncbi:hypothetical protein BFG60_3474 [Microcystis aeruginosa NIES-98]|nr:hypothetical protein BFG60_3474 [Microcystis aeruginosa NIES-98]
MAGTFLFPKSLKVLPNEVFRFIQQPLISPTIENGKSLQNAQIYNGW